MPDPTHTCPFVPLTGAFRSLSPKKMAVRAPAALTVLIIDDDLGFVLWLGELFTEARCRALPALSCQEAVARIEQLGIEPDFIVLNPHLPGVSEMLQRYIQALRHFKIVTIAPPPVLSVLTSAHAMLERPSANQPISRREWLAKVRKLLGEEEEVVENRIRSPL